MSVTDYAKKFGQIRVNKSNGHISPHKVCMLLALLDMARAGALRENRIYFSPSLLERYDAYFERVRTESDQPNPHLPFFHLSGDLTSREKSFWQLMPKPGHESALQRMREKLSAKDVIEHIDAATLDAELFALLQSEQNIEALSQAIEKRWLSGELEPLTRTVRAERDISYYERQLRSLETRHEPKTATQTRVVRDSAFRRVITELYDYRCAASNERVVLDTGRAMVEAAHIIPFSFSNDNSPRNGLALSPTMHWAMDNNLIAPGPDKKWHTSRRLDPKDPDHHFLVCLEGKPLHLPRNPALHPHEEACEWRMAALRTEQEIKPY